MASEKTARATAAATGAGRARRGPNPWRVAAWTLALLVLALPLAAMQVTDEVNWTASDFVFAAFLIGGVGGAFELAVRRSRNLAYRLGVAALLVTAFAMVWINAAVGVIGDEDNPLNALYAVVLAIAAIGAGVARFRAAGMVRAMTATAGAQLLVSAVAVVAGRTEPPGALGEAILNGGFVLGFACAAWLFAIAARGGSAR